MKIQTLFITGLSALTTTAVPIPTNGTNPEPNSPIVLHEYKPPSHGIRCDIDDIGPTAHGDGIAQLVDNLKSTPGKPPIMNPGMRQRAGCYFGAVIWWEPLRYNTKPLALESWDMIWQGVQNIKDKCMHRELPVLPCCDPIKQMQVSGLAQYDDYVIWINGGEECSSSVGKYGADFTLITTTVATSVAAATPSA